MMEVSGSEAAQVICCLLNRDRGEMERKRKRDRENGARLGVIRNK